MKGLKKLKEPLPSFSKIAARLSHISEGTTGILSATKFFSSNRSLIAKINNGTYIT